MKKYRITIFLFRLISFLLLTTVSISALFIILNDTIPSLNIAFLNKYIHLIIISILSTPWLVLMTLIVDFICSKNIKMLIITLIVFITLILMTMILVKI